VDLRRLAKESTPDGSVLEKESWETLDDSSIKLGINPCDPSSNFNKKDLLAQIVGQEKVDIPYNQRSDQLTQELNLWYRTMDWWMALKRVNYPVRFVTASGPAAGKKQRIA